MRWICGGALALWVLVASGPAQAQCLWGFGWCTPSNPIVGEYVLESNPAARLAITTDKITSSLGPVSFTTDYVLKSVEGNDVTIEVSPLDTKIALRIRVEKDLIRIGTQHAFAGDWKRKAAAR